jgi:leukotriene-A4 hydrolase
VITEPLGLELAAKELEDLEDGIKKIEEYTGVNYVWGTYAILVLPPSFPFGGMENPLLTFVSPTIIVGDKSEVSVANHEIAHSWSGNLVTNINWDAFWLNEGFTVFIERKVAAAQNGLDFAKINA